MTQTPIHDAENIPLPLSASHTGSTMSSNNPFRGGDDIRSPTNAPPFASGGLGLLPEQPEQPAELQAPVPPQARPEPVNADAEGKMAVSEDLLPTRPREVAFAPTPSSEHPDHQEQLLSPVSSISTDSKLREPPPLGEHPSQRDDDMSVQGGDHNALVPAGRSGNDSPPYTPADHVPSSTAPLGVSATASALPAALPEKKSLAARVSSFGSRAAAKVGTPGFLPQALGKECDKTAHILRAFCKNGIYVDSGKTKGARALLTIPSKVISRAVGLAIFTTLRAGYFVTGAIGSGLLVARLPDGSWSPPSAISVLNMGAGLQLGVDVYDCVCVINTKSALAAFTSTRVSIGSDIAVTAGPFGAGGAMEVGGTISAKDGDKKSKKGKEAAEPAPAGVPPVIIGDDSSSTHSGLPRQDSNQAQGSTSKSRGANGSLKPVFSYVKSRGFYAGVQVDGTVIVERKDANATFYGAPIRVDQILRGEVPSGGNWQAGVQVLHDVLRGAEGAQPQAPQQPYVAGTRSVPSESGPSSGISVAAPGAPVEADSSGLPGVGSTSAYKPYEAFSEPPAHEVDADEPPPAYEATGFTPPTGDRKQG
jgi:lipid-binding SYLF domain-containing protein